MKTVIVLAGLPGSGKTHLRLTDPELSGLLFADIADIYKEAREQYGFVMEWDLATETLIRRYWEILHQNDTVVVEGVFMPGSPSRQMLMNDARVGGYELVFRDITADPVECDRRIRAQFDAGEIDWPTANSRLKILWGIVNKR